MRPFEWIIALFVVIIAWHWLRGLRPGSLVAILGGVAVVCSMAIEKPRAVMVPAYLVILIALVLSLRSSPAGSPKAGVLRIAGRGLLVLAVLVLGVALPWLWPVIKLPTPTGPHPIGTTWLVIRDTSRSERFSSDPSARREFPVQVWYPAAPGATGRRAPYARPEEMSFLGIIPKFLAAQARLVKTHAILDAPPAEGRAPVLIFSHGYTGYIAQNTPQVEELVSRGYVVASIGHTGEAAAVAFPDGRVVPIDSTVLAAMMKQMEQTQGDGADPVRMFDSIATELTVQDPVLRQANFRKFLSNTPEPLRSESVKEWASDTKALLDELERIASGAVQSPLRDRFDLDRVGVFGMSYGGATAGEFCAQDRRCKAAINIDGGQYGRLVDDSLMVPLLIIGSSQAHGAHVPALDLTRGPAWLIRVPETNHIGLTDLSLQGPLFGWMGVTGKLDPDRREAIMTDYTVGFFEKYLMNRNPELWDGLAARYPEVVVQSRGVP
jgi:predicted dienelactone hydrolase